jgi:hypothetical protein
VGAACALPARAPAMTAAATIAFGIFVPEAPFALGLAAGNSKGEGAQDVLCGSRRDVVVRRLTLSRFPDFCVRRAKWFPQVRDVFHMRVPTTSSSERDACRLAYGMSTTGPGAET